MIEAKRKCKDSYQLSQEFLEKLAAFLHLILGPTELHDVTFLRLVRKCDDDLHREGKKQQQKTETHHIVIFILKEDYNVTFLRYSSFQSHDYNMYRVFTCVRNSTTNKVSHKSDLCFMFQLDDERK